MNKKQRKIYEAIYQKPIPSNIAWRDIENLFIHLGAELIPGKGSRVSVVLNNEIAVFHKPHPQKETDKGSVKAVADFLKIAGVNEH